MPTRRRIPGIVPLTIREQIAVIPLSRGKTAVIDAADWSKIDGFNWAVVGPNPRGDYYAYRSLNDGKMLYLHRALMDAPADMMVDHRNGRTLDCRRENLRLATRTQNNANSRGHGRNSSGYRGVSFDRERGLWEAYVSHGGRKYHLGRFASREDAAAIRRERERELFGEFVRS